MEDDRPVTLKDLEPLLEVMLALPATIQTLQEHLVKAGAEAEAARALLKAVVHALPQDALVVVTEVYATFMNSWLSSRKPEDQRTEIWEHLEDIIAGAREGA